MSRIPILLTLAALATGPLLLSTPSRADAPTPPAPRSHELPTPTVWTEPPEAVRAATAALRDACATWPQQIPRPPEANLSTPQRGKPAEAVVCEAALDPFGRRVEPMIAGALLAAAGAGAAWGAYATVVALLWLLRTGLRRMAGAVRELHPRRRQGWQE